MDNINDEYIDVNDALRRIGGSMDLYKRLLGQFASGEHIQPLEEALNSGNTEEASRKLHALKGVSANLSLAKLSVISAELEHMVIDGIDHADSLVELKSVYDITLQEIGKIL